MDYIDFEYNSNTILIISCEDFQLSIAGYKKAKRIKSNLNEQAQLIISGLYADRVTVKSIGNDGQLIDSKDGVMLPSFYENGEYQIILEIYGEDDLKILHMDNDLPKAMQKFSNYKVGQIKFISDIGYSTFSIVNKKGTSLLDFTIEVFPSKLDYKTDYKEIIENLSSLAFSNNGKTYLNLELLDIINKNNTDYINILKSKFEELEHYINIICRNFKGSCKKTESVSTSQKSKIAVKNSISYLRNHPNVLIESDQGFITLTNDSNRLSQPKEYFPSKLITEKTTINIDIFENRFVKFIIYSIINRLAIIGTELIKSSKENKLYLIFINEKRKILENYISFYFKEIGTLKGEEPNSLTFQLSGAYREIYKIYLTLEKSLSVGQGLIKVTPKKIYKLYELWCYIKIHQFILENGYTVIKDRFFYSRDNIFDTSIASENGNFITYQKDSKIIELYYNKSYSKLPTTVQIPDIVLTIKDSIGAEERTYLFDAKYRVKIEEDICVPLEEDINVMHRYRDAIVCSRDNDSDYSHILLGAFVIFPCSDEVAFKSHRFFKSITEVGIGALPMLPGSLELMKGLVFRIIG